MPRYTDSEIFENFEKIASEKGLISKAKPHEHRSAKEIAELHNKKPEMIDGLKYKKNLIEVAHPESSVLFNAHDKINGLVENDAERQNIMINIVNRHTHGNLNTRKLAQEQLLKSLIKVANDLDNRDEEDLRVLADACIADLQKQADILKKIQDFFGERGDDVVETGKGVAGGAVVGGVIGGILGGIFGMGAGAIPGAILGAKIGGVAGGLIAAVAKTAPQARSVATNAQDTINQLNDLISKFPNNQFLQNVHKDLEEVKNLAEQYSNLSNTGSPQTGDSTKSEEITKAYIAKMEKIKLVAATFIGKAKHGDFAEQQDLLSKFKTPLYWFIDDDVEDVTDSLTSLVRAINAAEAGIQQVKSATKLALIQHQSEQSNQDESPDAMLANLQKLYPGGTKG